MNGVSPGGLARNGTLFEVSVCVTPREGLRLCIFRFHALMEQPEFKARIVHLLADKHHIAEIEWEFWGPGFEDSLFVRYKISARRSKA